MQTTDEPSLLPPWRAIALGLLTPLLVLLERGAYYGTRAVLILWMFDSLLMDDETAFGWYSWLGIALVFSPFLGGLLAVLTGPYPLLLLGSLVMVAAYMTLPLAGELSLYLPLGLMVLGQGLLKPSVYAIAGSQFRRQFTNLRTATMATLYGAINLGAVVSVVAAGFLGTELGYAAAFGLSAGLSGVVLLLALITWAIGWGRETEPPLDADAARRFAAGLTLAPVAFVFWFLFSGAGMVTWSATDPWVQQVNPSVVLGTCGLVVIAALVGQVLRFRIPAMPAVAVALLLAVPGAALTMLPATLSSTALIVASLALLAGPEALFGAFALSRLTGDLPSRLSPLLLSTWFAASFLGGMAGEKVAELASPLVVQGLGIAGCVVLAFLALVAWKPLEWAAFKPPGTEGDGEAAEGQTA